MTELGAPSTTRWSTSAHGSLAAAPGALAMGCVGGSVAVSSVLDGGPLFAAQAIRYAAACLLLAALARVVRRRIPTPAVREWPWLIAVAVSGLVVFNVALVRGSRHAEPAVLGVAVACVPILLAVVGPLLEGGRPTRMALLAAADVTVGAALVQGVGHADAAGLAWAIVVLCCEAGFTLLALPVLGRLGPWGVSLHTTWIAAVLFAILSVLDEGAGAVGRLTGGDLLAVAYLAVAVTAIAFVLWYSTVSRIGAAAAGLLTGVAPIAAAGTGVALGDPAPSPLVWVGIAVVIAGLAIGLGVRPRP